MISIPALGTSDSARQAHQLLPLLTLIVPAVAMMLHFIPHGHNNQRLFQLALLGAVVIYLYLQAPLLRWPMRRVLGSAITLFFLLGIVAANFAYAPLYALMEVGLLFLLLMTGLAIGREMRNDYERTLGWVLAIIAIGSAAYVTQASIGYTILLSLGQMPHVGDLIQNFENYRSFNYAQTITLPMLVLLCCMTNRRPIKALVILLTGCWWALLFATGGRGVMLGQIAAVSLVLLLRGRHAWRFSAMTLATAFAGFLINKVMFVGLPLALGLQPFGLLSGLVQRSVSDPTSMRTILWQRCIEIMLADPWLGIGPLQFAHHAMDLKIASSPHSWLFQFGAEWGLPALACLCVAIFAGAATLVRRAAAIELSDKPNQLIATGLLAIGTAILADGLVSGSLVLPVSQLLIALYVGCASGWVWSRSVQQATLLPQRLAVSGAMAAAALAVLLGVAIDLGQIPGSDINNAADTPDHIYYPRFWFDGRF